MGATFRTGAHGSSLTITAGSPVGARCSRSENSTGFSTIFEKLKPWLKGWRTSAGLGGSPPT
jgi:hypothetical protein